MAGLKRTGEQKGFERYLGGLKATGRQMFEDTTKNEHTQALT